MTGLRERPTGFSATPQARNSPPIRQRSRRVFTFTENSKVLSSARSCAHRHTKFIDNYAKAFPAQAKDTKAQGVLGLSKIVGVAVSEDAGAMASARLIQMTRADSQRCGISMIHGSCSPGFDDDYIKRLRFKVETIRKRRSISGSFSGLHAFWLSPGMHVLSQSHRSLIENLRVCAPRAGHVTEGSRGIHKPRAWNLRQRFHLSGTEVLLTKKFWAPAQCRARACRARRVRICVLFWLGQENAGAPGRALAEEDL